MAEAPNIQTILVLVEILFILWALPCLLGGSFFAHPNIREPSLRQELRRKHYLRPKVQFRYHWVKSKMKRKKKKKFRKPPALFHLTWKFKAVAYTVKALKLIDCCVGWRYLRSAEVVVSRLLGFLRHLRDHTAICRTTVVPIVAYTSETPLHEPPIRARFDTDSFPIGVDSLCSITMSPVKDCFQDLRYFKEFVGGIVGGLPAKGVGTFCFKIEDDTGRVHTIKLPNSLFVPGLPKTLLCPQHWAQKDKSGTYMKMESEGCWLVWNGGKCNKFVPLDPKTNTPTFQTAPGSFNYRAFEATFLAMDASYHNRHRVALTNPLRRVSTLDPAEFIADENVNFPPRAADSKGSSYRDLAENEGASSDDETVKTNNLSRPFQDNQHCPLHPTGHHVWGECTLNPNNADKTERRGTLTFSPTPSREDKDLANDALEASDDQAELLRWHCRLGHLPFEQLKQLAKWGEIPKRFEKVTTPKCAGCLFGKMTKLPWRTKAKNINKVFEATHAGQCVSVDQLQSTEAGFLAQLKGKLTKRRYTAATVFIDHYSRLRYVHLMNRMTSEETIQAKEAFERFANDYGVKIQHYHADNGRFADNAFKQHCEANKQTLTFCGVNAHFQNGIAERAIRDITEQARTMLLHAKARWPDAVHLALWPYAIRCAVHVYNTAPVLEGGISRIERFCGVNVGFRMKDHHAFGCPVFALQNDLAAGNKIPKWSPRARLGLNLGPSPHHARNVYVVLNLQTGLCSPQYHCRFDDFFETVRQSIGDSMTSSGWKYLAGFAKHQVTPRVPSSIGGSVESVGTHHDQNQSVPQEVSFFQDNDDVTQPSASVEPSVADIDMEVSEGATTPSTDGGTSSRGRSRKLGRAMQDSISQRDFYGDRGMHYMEAHQAITCEEAEYLYAKEHDFHLGLQERMRHPIAFHAEMMGDIMYYHQAIRQPDAAEFVKAIVKEVNAHIDEKHWKLIKRTEVPPDVDVIPSVWSMRRKRDLTTNAVTKYKSRLNIHGGKQVYGMNYFETYAPVVTWFAIRLLLIGSIIFTLALRQIDFVLAYPQAPIEQDMFMELPHGIETRHGNSKEYVLQLLANLYGQKQAGRVWNTYLVEKLREIGFKTSNIDECVLYRDNVIFILYVDDGIFMCKQDEKITQVIEDIRKAGLNIDDQGHPADYVGVNIKQHPNGFIELSQRALIDSVIEDCGLQDAYSKPVPAKTQTQLHAFKTSKPFSECDFKFEYRSIVGKTNYLAQTTRPDIIFAVHQIAKYSSDPRLEHGEAIEYLVRYLKGSRDIGIRFRPDPSCGFECYCDADFSGNWNKQFAPYDPSTAKSRSGWVVFYAKCPIIWASKLQSQVALSTTEAEYIAMSMALRDVIPIMELLQEMRELGHQVICTQPIVYCKVFEDNSGALELARLPKLRPRTKHINVCYHHFREHVRTGIIKILHVSTEDQIADALTKPLAQNLLRKHRLPVCGG